MRQVCFGSCGALRCHRKAIKDLHQSGDAHQSKGGIIRHRDVKVMFDNMASNSGLKVLTKNHNFKVCSMLWDVAVHPRACLPVLWSCD